MDAEGDDKDRKETRKMAAALIFLIILLTATIVLLAPILSEIISQNLSPGINLKDSAVISFFVTVAVMVLFALVSGDGLVGEIQFVLGSFFAFYLTIWLSIAWIF